MYVYYRDEAYKFNEEESLYAVKLCNNFLQDMKKQCEEKDIRTFYVMLLFIMHHITEHELDNIGIEGIQAMFMKRMHIEKMVLDENTNKED